MMSGLARLSLPRRRVARLRLDFAHPGGRIGPAGLLLLGLGLLASTLVAVRLQRVGAELAQLEAATAQLPARVAAPVAAGRAAGGTNTSLLALKNEQVQAALASLATPWDAWFSQLEAVAERGVALVSLQPENEGRRVRLSGEARRFEDVLAYMGRLEAAEGFANVFLSEHVEAGPGVSFSLGADWVGRP